MEDLKTAPPELGQVQPRLWLPPSAREAAGIAMSVQAELILGSIEDKEKQMGKFTDYGTLNEVINPENSELFVHPKEKIWTGKISLADRLSNDPELLERVNTALLPENLEPYYVIASLQARTRCIDGRLLADWLQSLDLQNRPLGPQFPGGTPTMALAMRLVDAELLNSGVTLAEDIDTAIIQLTELGLSFGGHIDENNSEGATGCGAIDQLRGILQKFQQPETSFQMRGLVKSVLGDDLDTDVYNSIIGELQPLWAMESRYLNEHNGTFEYNTRAIKALQKRATNEDPVAKLVGKHNEVGLVVNTVEGTTFNTDKFNADNSGELQLFNYDIWYSKKLAEALYPTNTSNQNKFLTIRAMFAVATAMQLTDGTGRLLVRN